MEVEETKQSLLAKPLAFGKRHWKKAVGGILLAAAGVAGYMVGKQVGVDSVDVTGDGYDDEAEDYEAEDNRND